MSYDIRLVSLKKKVFGLKNAYKIEEYHEDYTKNFIKNYFEDLTESRHLFVRKERVCVYYTYLRKLNTISRDYFGFCFAFTSEYIEDIKKLFNVCEDLISKIVYQKELLQGTLPLDLTQHNKFIDKQPELLRIEGWFKDLVEEENLIIPFKPSSADSSKIKMSIDKPNEEILFAIKNYNNVNYYINDIIRENFLKQPIEQIEKHNHI